MKKLLLGIILLSILPFLFSCDTDESPQFKMIARVCAIGEEIAVFVIEDEFSSGDFLIITSERTIYQTENGEKIKRSDLAVGNTVEITYNGQTMLSYPPKVVASKIVLK
jgi:hypothetical protein